MPGLPVRRIKLWLGPVKYHGIQRLANDRSSTGVYGHWPGRGCFYRSRQYALCRQGGSYGDLAEVAGFTVRRVQPYLCNRCRLNR